jgi:hypothetical protein
MKFRNRLFEGLKAAFEDKWRISSTLFTSSLFFVLLALSTSINYSIQMFSSGFQYWIPAIEFTIRGFYLNGGWTEVTLNIIYSLLVGIVINNTYTEFKNTGLKIGNLSGIAPGVLVAGCAGCGVGLLSLIGLTGILTVLPFQGLSLKIGGIFLTIYFIAKIGNPKVCSIPS